MSSEEFTALVGKMQRLRAQRVQQIAYARQLQQTQTQSAPATSQQATTPAESTAARPPSARLADQRIRSLEDQMSELTEEIRQLQGQLADFANTDTRQQALRLASRDSSTTNRKNEAQPSTKPVTTTRRESEDNNQRIAQLERQLADERERNERDLRDERDRIRRLERDLNDTRKSIANDRSDYDRDRNRDRQRDINVNVPAVVPIPSSSPRVDTVVRTVEVGRSSDSLLLRQQDSLQRSLAALQLEVQRRNRTDTIIVERTATPTIIRDTVRSTVTRTVVEDRLDLAAVLFANASSQLDASAEAQVQQALEAYRRESDATILLRGFASKTGNAAFNQVLSTRRATAVKDRLVVLGVPPTQIRVIGNGIDDGTSLAQARRVEIQLLRKPDSPR